VPAHVDAVPPIAAGDVFTVTTAVETHEPLVKDMVAVPPATPVATPLKLFTVAIDVLPLAHVPPAEALLKAVVAPTHTVNVPVIGELPTVIFLVAAVPQPVE
jgi:hypothetical protein